MSKIEGWIDIADTMPTGELRTSIRIHANESDANCVPATLVIGSGEEAPKVWTADELRVILDDLRDAAGHDAIDSVFTELGLTL